MVWGKVVVGAVLLGLVGVGGAWTASKIRALGPGAGLNWGSGTGLVLVENGVGYRATCVGCQISTVNGGKVITFPGAVLPVPVQQGVVIPIEASGQENYTFSIAAIPLPNTLAVFRNGQLQVAGDDYSIVGAQITLLKTKCDAGASVGGCWWTPEDWVQVMYVRAP